jgi:hypothetical protein
MVQQGHRSSRRCVCVPRSQQVWGYFWAVIVFLTAARSLKWLFTVPSQSSSSSSSSSPFFEWNSGNDHFGFTPFRQNMNDMKTNATIEVTIPRKSNHHHENTNTSRTTIPPSCNHWVVATFRDSPTTSSIPLAIDTIGQVAKQILGKDNIIKTKTKPNTKKKKIQGGDKGAYSHQHKNHWCMVVVLVGWWTPQDELQIERAIQTYLDSRIVAAPQSTQREPKETLQEPYDQPPPPPYSTTSKIVILTTQNIQSQFFPVTHSGNYDTISSSRTKSMPTDTKMADPIPMRKLLQTFLESISSTKSSSTTATTSSNPAISTPLAQINLGNLFALHHGAQTILELQVDALQFHSSSSSFFFEQQSQEEESTKSVWETVYGWSGVSSSSSAESRLGKVHVGLLGTHVWNPYHHYRSTDDDYDNESSKSRPRKEEKSWYGPLPAPFHASFQEEAQQTAYSTANVELVLGGQPEKDDNEHYKDDSAEEGMKQRITRKSIGTISFVVQPRAVDEPDTHHRRLDGSDQAEEEEEEEEEEDEPLLPKLIPSHSSCPYTSMATWHLQPTLWSLILPLSLQQQEQRTQQSSPNSASSPSSSLWPLQEAEQFRAYTTRFLLQEYNVNLLVVDANPGGTILRPLTTMASHTVSQHDLNKDGERNSNHHRADETATLSRVMDWLHHSCNPTITESSTNSTGLAGTMEGLWIALYKMGVLAESDVVMVQQWLAVFTNAAAPTKKTTHASPSASGNSRNHNGAGLYTFPARKRYKQYHVAVMGQFNSPAFTPLSSVVFWVQLVRQHFHHVAVAGSFSFDMRNALESYGILVVPYMEPLPEEEDNDFGDNGRRNKKKQKKRKDTQGYYPPLDHLAWTLQYYNSQSVTHPVNGGSNTAPLPVEGVLYLHDDALINVTEWMANSTRHNGSPVFPTDAIIANRYKTSHAMSMLNYQVSTSPPSLLYSNDTDALGFLSRYSYTIHVVVPEVRDATTLSSEKDKFPTASSLDYYFTNPLGQRFDSKKELLESSPLIPWYGYDPWCIPGQVRIVQTAAAHYFSSTTTKAAPQTMGRSSIDSSSRHPLPPGFSWDGPDYDYRGIFQKHISESPSGKTTVEVSFAIVPYTQADVLFVPVSVAQEFATAVAMHTASNPKVFLECAMPSIVDMVHQVSSIPVRTVVLCTMWNPAGGRRSRIGRGSAHMVWSCIRNPPIYQDGMDYTVEHDQFNAKNVNLNPTETEAPNQTYEVYAVYHPFKLSNGFKIWGELWEAANNN